MKIYKNQTNPAFWSVIEVIAVEWEVYKHFVNNWDLVMCNTYYENSPEIKAIQALISVMDECDEKDFKKFVKDMRENFNKIF